MPKVKSLPRGVAMVGAGMSKFGAFAEKNSRDLFVESYKAMTKSVDKGFDPSRSLKPCMLVIFPATSSSIRRISRPFSRTRSVCSRFLQLASKMPVLLGGVALRQGVMAIASGMADVVLVGGQRR
jgi:acetyl-CoA C-acetyltransferase